MGVATKYYLTAFVVIVVLPAVLIALYEWLAGGILNGLAGSWREAVIHPDIFLLFINPLLLAGGYGLLILRLRQYTKEEKSRTVRFFASLVFAVATITVLVGVFWKVMTA